MLASSRQHRALCPLKSVQIKSLQALFVSLLALVLTQFYFWHFPCRLWSLASSIWRLIWDSVFLVASWKSPLMAWFIPVMPPRRGKKEKKISKIKDCQSGLSMMDVYAGKSELLYMYQRITWINLTVSHGKRPPWSLLSISNVPGGMVSTFHSTWVHVRLGPTATLTIHTCTSQHSRSVAHSSEEGEQVSLITQRLMNKFPDCARVGLTCDGYLEVSAV